MNKLFKKIARNNVKELRAELARAHLIIALLSIIAIVLLILGTNLTVSLNPYLSTSAGILLTIVAATSTIISYSLFTNKK